MTKNQVIRFLKAPLNLKCFIAYLFIIPVLFIVPFIKDVLGILPVKDGVALLALMNTPNFFVGVIGAFIGVELLYGFCVSLSNKLVNSSESPFDLILPKISISDVVKGFICNILRFLCCSVFMALFVMLISALLLVGFYVVSFLPTSINVLLAIFFLPVIFILFFCLMLYMWISYMRFLKTWQVYTCFMVTDNFHYLKKYKGRVLLVCLIMFVLAQIGPLLMGKIGMNLIPGIYPFNARCVIETIRLVGCLLFGFVCFTYIALLQAIIQAKAIAWIEYSSLSRK